MACCKNDSRNARRDGAPTCTTANWPCCTGCTLAKALHEYGRLVRTIYICRYVAKATSAEGTTRRDKDLFDLDTELSRKHRRPLRQPT